VDDKAQGQGVCHYANGDQAGSGTDFPTTFHAPRGRPATCHAPASRPATCHAPTGRPTICHATALAAAAVESRASCPLCDCVYARCRCCRRKRS